MASPNFEKALQQLEEIVQELEAGDLPLEKALKRFEDDIRLSKLCAQKLDETEKRVTLLMRDSAGNLSETPFAEKRGENDV
jgi:exodeoxyribonuclease VII small subunit